MLLAEIESWQWYCIGVVLIVLEVLAIFEFLIAIGLAAISVGVINNFFVPFVMLRWQIISFVVISLSLSFLFKHYFYGKKDSYSVKKTNINTIKLIGKVTTLESKLTHGFGYVYIDDAIWQVKAKGDIAMGAKVIVVGSEGSILKVAPLDSFKNLK